METDFFDHPPCEYETLFGLVRRYSPSGFEFSAVSWLIERMRQLGYHQAFADGAGNAVGIIGKGARQLVLLGHIDTVPGEIPVEVRTGNLYGRGAVDAKGSLACFVDSAAEIGEIEGWQIIVIACVDEECDGMGARFVLNQYHPEAVIVGEPSRWDRIALGYKGCAWASIQVLSDLSHGASDEETPCETATKIWKKIEHWRDEYNATRPKMFDKIMVSLTNWYSGKDGFQQWARIVISTRIPPGFYPEDFYRKLEEIAPDANISHSAFPTPAYRCEKNTSVVKAFLPAIRATGGTPIFVYKTGTADLNLIAPAWNCPGLAYGPGDSTLDHTPNEHLNLEEFLRAKNVLKKAVQNLMRN